MPHQKVCNICMNEHTWTKKYESYKKCQPIFRFNICFLSFLNLSPILEVIKGHEGDLASLNLQSGIKIKDWGSKMLSMPLKIYFGICYAFITGVFFWNWAFLCAYRFLNVWKALKYADWKKEKIPQPFYSSLYYTTKVCHVKCYWSCLIFMTFNLRFQFPAVMIAQEC